MKYVAQKDGFGCGIACVAMATGLSYCEAKNYFNKQYAIRRGYHCKNIVAALQTITGQSYRFKKFRSDDMSKFDDGTIIFVSNPMLYDNGHYLVKLGARWGDSWINCNEQNNLAVSAGGRATLPGSIEWIIYKNS